MLQPQSITQAITESSASKDVPASFEGDATEAEATTTTSASPHRSTDPAQSSNESGYKQDSGQNNQDEKEVPKEVLDKSEEPSLLSKIVGGVRRYVHPMRVLYSSI